MENPRYSHDENEPGPWCGECRPELEPDALGPEVDYFLHCVGCNRPLECSVLSHGVEHILGCALDVLYHWPDDRDERLDKPGDYYHGCRHIESLRDQAKDLRWYSLSKGEDRLLRLFLDITGEDSRPEPIAADDVVVS